MFQPPLPPPPAPLVYQVGTIDSDSQTVAVVSGSSIAVAAAAYVAGSIAASAAASVAASTAASVAASAAASAAGCAAGSAISSSVATSGIGAASGTLSGAGATAAALFVSHLQLFALTTHAASNTTQQYRQVNGDLAWLNLDLPTLSMRGGPVAEARAYNQLLNSAFVLCAGVALHAGVLVLFRSWAYLGDTPLPSWFAFPFPELFIATFCLPTLSAGTAVLLASAVRTGRRMPAIVGGIVASVLLAFFAATAWVVYRLHRAAHLLGLSYRPKAKELAAHRNGGNNHGAATAAGGGAGHGSKDTASGGKEVGQLEEQPPLAPSRIAGQGGYAAEAMEGTREAAAGDEGGGASASVKAKTKPKGEAEHTVVRALKRVELGEWNRPVQAEVQMRIEPYRTQKYLRDGLSLRAAVRCLYPPSAAELADLEAKDARRRRRRDLALQKPRLLEWRDEEHSLAAQTPAAALVAVSRAALAASRAAPTASVASDRGTSASTLATAAAVGAPWKPGPWQSCSQDVAGDVGGHVPQGPRAASSQGAGGSQRRVRPSQPSGHGEETRGPAWSMSFRAADNPDEHGAATVSGPAVLTHRSSTALWAKSTAATPPSPWHPTAAGISGGSTAPGGVMPSPPAPPLPPPAAPLPPLPPLPPPAAPLPPLPPLPPLRLPRASQPLPSASDDSDEGTDAVNSAAHRAAASHHDVLHHALQAGRHGQEHGALGLGQSVKHLSRRSAVGRGSAVSGPSAWAGGRGGSVGGSVGGNVGGGVGGCGGWPTAFSEALLKAPSVDPPSPHEGQASSAAAPPNVLLTPSPSGGLPESFPGFAFGSSTAAAAPAGAAAPDRAHAAGARVPGFAFGIGRGAAEAAAEPDSLPGPAKAESSVSVGGVHLQCTITPALTRVSSAVCPPKGDAAIVGEEATEQSDDGADEGFMGAWPPTAAAATAATGLLSRLASPPVWGMEPLELQSFNESNCPPRFITSPSEKAAPQPLLSFRSVQSFPRRKASEHAAQLPEQAPPRRPPVEVAPITAAVHPADAVATTFVRGPPPRAAVDATTVAAGWMTVALHPTDEPLMPSPGPRQLAYTKPPVTLVSFKENDVADAYITGGGPRLLMHATEPSAASLTARHDTATAVARAEEDEDSTDGVAGFSGRRFLPFRRVGGVMVSLHPTDQMLSSSPGPLPRVDATPPVDRINEQEVATLTGDDTRLLMPEAKPAAAGLTAPSAHDAAAAAAEEDAADHASGGGGGGGSGAFAYRGFVPSHREGNPGGSLAADSATFSAAETGDAGGHDSDTSINCDDCIPGAGTRLLLARTEVYDRYGLVFLDTQGDRTLAATFYIAIMLNATIPAMLLGLQTGLGMAPGSRSALIANAVLLAVKAAYAIYLTLVLPYINVILITAEVVCAWLETAVIACIVTIIAAGVPAGFRFLTPPPPPPAAPADSSSPPGGRVTGDDGGISTLYGRLPSQKVQGMAGDLMLAIELCVLGIQLVAKLLTVVIPSCFAIGVLVRAKLAHWRARRLWRRAAQAVRAPGMGAAAGTPPPAAGDTTGASGHHRAAGAFAAVTVVTSGQKQSEAADGGDGSEKAPPRLEVLPTAADTSSRPHSGHPGLCAF